MQSPVLATVGMSVCMSVRLSVTRWHRVKTTQARITKSPRITQGLLVFGAKRSSSNSKGFTPTEGVKWEWGRKNSQLARSWMTLNGYVALNSVFVPVWLALTVRLSKNNCAKTNKDRDILSTAQIFGSDSFWQYKVYGCGYSHGLTRKKTLKDSAWAHALTLVLNIFSWLSKTIIAYKKAVRKPESRKETARCRSCSFRFKVRRRHSLQV